MALPVTITGLSTAVAPVGPFKTGVMTSLSSMAGVTAYPLMGAGSAYQRRAQEFLCASDTVLRKVTVKAQRVGNPVVAHQFAVNIRLGNAASSTHPSGNPVLSNSPYVLGSSLSTTPQLVEFTLTTPVTLTAGSTYLIEISSSAGAVDASNYIAVLGAAGNPYANGRSFDYSLSGPWMTANTDVDYCFETKVDAPVAYYFFGHDSTFGGACKALKTTDPSTSWISSQTVTLANSGDVITQLAACQVDNVIHVVAGSFGGTTSQVRYSAFDTLTDTWSSQTGEIISASNNTAGQTGAQQNGVSIVVRSTGEPVVLYNGLQTNTSGTPRSRLYYSRRTGVNTWAAGVRVDANIAADNRGPKCIIGATDSIHFLWWTNSGLNQRTLSSANALQTASTIVNSGNATIDAASYVQGGTTYCTSASDTCQIATFTSANTPTLTARPQLPGSNARVFVDTTNPAANVEYVLYRANSDSDLWQYNSTAFWATYSGPVSVFAGLTVPSPNGLPRDAKIYVRGGATVIPYVVNDNGTWKYNEYVVRAAPIADAWNKDDKVTTVTLSNNDKKVTASSTTTTNNVRSTTGYAQSAGKYYAEFVMDVLAGGTNIVGVVPKSISITGSNLHNNVGSAAISTNGPLIANGTVFHTGVAYGAGAVVGVAYDAVAGKFWARVDDGLWNYTAGSDPATGVSGASVSVTAGEAALYACISNNTNSVTLRTEVAEFTKTAPSGFLSWMGEVLGPALPIENYVKHAGVWKKPTATHVKHAGTWKTATTFVKHAGTWKQMT